MSPDAITVTSNRLTYGTINVPCATGKAGFTTSKREGDNATPVGTFTLEPVVYYRADRLPAPPTAFEVRAIAPGMAWDDQPGPSYNQLIEGAAPDHPESLWREDHLYDMVVFVQYNWKPAVPGQGSAIFIHLARNQDDPPSSPTAGCIALREADYQQLLATIEPGAAIQITA